MINKVILMGRLTREPELKQTPNGIAVARFSVAINRRFAKEGQQQADFIECVAWRHTAEFVTNYFHKGNMIGVVGSIQSRSWDDADGKKRYATEVLAEEVYFTGSKNDGSTAQNQPQYQAPPQQQSPNNNPFGGGFNDFAPSNAEDELPFPV